MELWGRLRKSYIECKLRLCRVFTLGRMASLAQQRLAHKHAKFPQLVPDPIPGTAPHSKYLTRETV